MGRLPDLADPRRFTEFVQWRKLHDRAPHHGALMDKIAAKEIAGAALGADWITPTLWAGTALPARMPFALPAIVKARHGCNQNAVLRHPLPAWRWAALRLRARQWMAARYGYWLDEGAYAETPRGLMAKPLLDGGGGALPVDYKIYVFGGQATHIQVHLDRRAGRHRWVLHDRDFGPLVPGPERPARPASLAAMLAAAETLAARESFCRADFNEIDGRPRFGEFCLYPGSGLDRFAADWIDRELADLWRAALTRHTQTQFLG